MPDRQRSAGKPSACSKTAGAQWDPFPGRDAKHAQGRPHQHIPPGRFAPAGDIPSWQSVRRGAGAAEETRSRRLRNLTNRNI